MKKTEQQQQQQKTVIICQSYIDTTDSIAVDNEDLFSSFSMHMFTPGVTMSQDYAIANSFYFGDKDRLAALHKSQKIEHMRPYLTAPLMIRAKFSNLKHTDRAIFSMLRLMTILKKDYMTKVISCALDELAIEHKLALGRVKSKLEKQGISDLYQSIDSMFDDIVDDPDQDIDLVLTAIEKMHGSNSSWTILESMIFIRAIQTFMPYVDAYFRSGTFTASDVMLLMLYARGWSIIKNGDESRKEGFRSSFLCNSVSHFATSAPLFETKKSVDLAAIADVDVSARTTLRKMIERNPLVASTCMMTVLSTAHMLHVYRFGTEPCSTEVMLFMSVPVEKVWGFPKGCDRAKLKCGRNPKIVSCNHADLRNYAVNVHMHIDDGKVRTKNKLLICTSFSGMPLSTLRDDDDEVLQLIENLLSRFVRTAWDNEKDKFVRNRILSAYKDLKGQTAYEVSNWLAFELCYVRNLYPGFPEFLEFTHVPERRLIMARWNKIVSLFGDLLKHQAECLAQFHAELENGACNEPPPQQQQTKKKNNKKNKNRNKNKNKSKKNAIDSKSTLVCDPVSSGDSDATVNDEEKKDIDDSNDDDEEEEEDGSDSNTDHEDAIVRDETVELSENPFKNASAPPMQFCEVCQTEYYNTHSKCLNGQDIETALDMYLDTKMKIMSKSILPDDQTTLDGV